MLACRVVDSDGWSRPCGCEGSPHDSVTRHLSHESFGWLSTRLLVTDRRDRCSVRLTQPSRQWRRMSRRSLASHLESTSTCRRRDAASGTEPNRAANRSAARSDKPLRVMEHVQPSLESRRCLMRSLVHHLGRGVVPMDSNFSTLCAPLHTRSGCGNQRPVRRPPSWVDAIATMVLPDP